MALPLSPEVFVILAAVIEERFGLRYSAQEAPLLAAKVSSRAIERGFESLLDYYYFLRYDPQRHAELDLLVDYLVVNETYFFREAEPLRVLIDVFLRPVIASGRRARVWSAACSTGEEPLSLAMMLANRGLLDQVDIVASDISARVLERARAAHYSGRALRELPHPEAGAHLRDGHAPFADRIDWRRVNLIEEMDLGKFDVILCRNVLIYFGEDNAAAVAARLVCRLEPQGALLVGVAESLLRFGGLVRCEEHGGYFFYRRPK